MRIGAAAAVLLLPFCGMPAQAQESDNLVRGADLALIKSLALEANLDVIVEDRSSIYVSDGTSWPMRIALAACEPDGCAYLRIRTRFEIGSSKAARAAADVYDRTVPIAFVATFDGGNGKVAVDVGRDVFVAPGRTRANLIEEIRFSLKMADVLRTSLIESDPALALTLRAPNVAN